MVDCERCTLCCRHVSVEVDEPEDEDDVDQYEWLILHEGVAVYVEDDKWYVEFKTDCKALRDDGTCDIYERRPRVCSGYDPKTCLMHGVDDWYEIYFDTPEKLRQHWKEMNSSRG